MLSTKSPTGFPLNGVNICVTLVTMIDLDNTEQLGIIMINSLSMFCSWTSHLVVVAGFSAAKCVLAGNAGTLNANCMYQQVNVTTWYYPFMDFNK